jgi:hypothetical protein
VKQFATLMFLLGLLSGAQAQTISDIELRAAYCLGVATEQEELSGRDAAAAPDRSARAVYEFAIAIIAERRNRFRDYLTAKGFLSGRDVSAIKLAITRGPSDVRVCESDLKSDFYKRCSNLCDRHSSEERRSSCNAACPSPEACQRVKKCLENFLPF